MNSEYPGATLRRDRDPTGDQEGREGQEFFTGGQEGRRPLGFLLCWQSHVATPQEIRREGRARRSSQEGRRSGDLSVSCCAGKSYVATPQEIRREGRARSSSQEDRRSGDLSVSCCAESLSWSPNLL
jgi:hypothetical protein